MALKIGSLRRSFRLFFIVAGLGVVALLSFVSIAVGSKDVSLATVAAALFDFNPDDILQQIIRELRISRTVAAVLTGCGFAVAGAIMQGLTRNPLGSPDILGVNAGATLAVALVLGFAPGIPFLSVILFAMGGAGVAALIVYCFSSVGRGGMTPVRLALAGASLTAFFLAVSQGVAIYTNVSRDMTFWSAGGLANIKWAQIELLVPCFLLGLFLALILSPSITVLSLGEDVATGLGQRKGLIKLGANVCVLLLSGSAVAVVGPIGFIGLIAPHLCRSIVGVDYRWIIPASGVYGALMAVLADIGGRLINPPAETPLGVITALIGVPFFVSLGRSGKRVLS